MPSSSPRTAFLALLALLLLGTLPLGRANASTEQLAQLRDQLRALEQKILILERQQELRDEAAATAAKRTTTLGPNWYLNRSVNASLNLEHTGFT